MTPVLPRCIVSRFRLGYEQGGVISSHANSETMIRLVSHARPQPFLVCGLARETNYLGYLLFI